MIGVVLRHYKGQLKKYEISLEVDGPLGPGLTRTKRIGKPSKNSLTITDMLGVVYYHVEFPDKIYTNKQLTERVSI